MAKIAAFIDYENIHIGMEEQFHVVPEPRKFAELISNTLRVNELEKSLPFVGLKYFCSEILEPSCQSDRRQDEAKAIINDVIQQGIVTTHKVENPKGKYPTTAIKLNRSNPKVKSILDDLEKEIEKSEEVRHTLNSLS